MGVDATVVREDRECKVRREVGGKAGADLDDWMRRDVPLFGTIRGLGSWSVRWDEKSLKWHLWAGCERKTDLRPKCT